MHIVYVISGAGQAFHNGSRLRDSSLVNGLRAAGHAVTVVPLFSTIDGEEGCSNGAGPLFFDAKRLFLEEAWPIVRHFPDRILDIFCRAMPRSIAAKRVDPACAGKGEKLTLAMLGGEAGSQAREFARTASWILRNCDPDALFISSLFLLGIGASIQARSAIPVFCFVQDEDLLIDGMDQRYREKVRNAIAGQCDKVARFFSADRGNVDRIAPVLRMNPERCATVQFGVGPANCRMAEEVLAVMDSCFSEDEQLTDTETEILKMELAAPFTA